MPRIYPSPVYGKVTVDRIEQPVSVYGTVDVGTVNSIQNPVTISSIQNPVNVQGTVNVGTVQNPITVSSIQNPVTTITYHLRYWEYPSTITLASGQTSATASVTFSDVARLVSVRAYGTYTPYVLEVLDGNNNVIYRYDAQSGETVVIDASVNVVLPRTVTVRVSVQTAPTSNQNFTVILGVLERVQA